MKKKTEIKTGEVGASESWPIATSTSIPTGETPKPQEEVPDGFLKQVPLSDARKAKEREKAEARLKEEQEIQMAEVMIARGRELALLAAIIHAGRLAGGAALRNNSGEVTECMKMAKLIRTEAASEAAAEMNPGIG